jgi:hypothetical protein
MSLVIRMPPRLRLAALSGVAFLLASANWATAQPPPFRKAQAEDLRLNVTIAQVGAWGGPVRDFQRVGNVGYCAAGNRLVTLDMTDPANITELGSVNLESSVNEFALDGGGFAYVMTEQIDFFRWSARPHVVDVSDPSAPQSVWSSAQYVNSMRQVELYSNANGDLAILQTKNGLTQALEISDPLNPIVMIGDSVWRFPTATGGFKNAVGDPVVRGDLLYGLINYAVGGGNPAFRGLAIYDLSGIDPGVLPMEPSLVGSVDLLPNSWSDVPRQVAVDGGHAYVVVNDYDDNERQVVLAVDVSNPSAPTVVSEYDDFVHNNTNYDLGDIAAANGLAYVADPQINIPPFGGDPNDFEGLRILDMLTDPNNPAVVGTYATHAKASYDLRVEGTTAHLFDQGEGLIVLDVSNPGAPVRLGNYHSPAVLRKIVRRGDLLYVADAWNGLSILDISDQSAPQLVGVYQSPVGVNHWGLDLQGTLAYLAAGIGGLEVIDISDPANPTLVGEVRDPPPFGWEFMWCTGVKIVGDVAYVGALIHRPGAQSTLVFSYDVSTPAAITVLDPDGVYVAGSSLAAAFDHDAARDLLYPTRMADSESATGETGFRVNISDPSNLQIDYPGWKSIGASYDPGGDFLATTDAEDPAHDPNGGLSLWSPPTGFPSSPTGFVPIDYAGAIDTHPLGTVVYGISADLVGEDGFHVLLFDTSDPSAPVLLASALGPSSLPDRYYRIFGDLLADERGIYLTRGSADDELERSTGLTIYEVRSQLTPVQVSPWP